MARFRVYLDTNVFVRGFEGEGAVSEALRRLLAAANDGRRFLLTSQLSLAETVQKPFTDGNDRLVDIYTGWLRDGTTSLEVAPNTADVLFEAAVLRSEYRALKLPDAIHVATALATGAHVMISDDKRLPAELKLGGPRLRRAALTRSVVVSPASVELFEEILRKVQE